MWNNDSFVGDWEINNVKLTYQLLRSKYKNNINVVNNDPIVILYYYSFDKSLLIYDKNKMIGAVINSNYIKYFVSV